MNVSVGVDTIAVRRFNAWWHYHDSQLRRVFSVQEIKYARSNEYFFAQRLAVRFAAKEAFFKALQQLFPSTTFSLLHVISAVHTIKSANGAPTLHVDWNILPVTLSAYPVVNVSLSHTDCCATAIVVMTIEHS